MTIPNLGVTQVIQQPGFGNVLGQSIGGISQMLMQLEKMKQEQAKNQAYNAYMAELAAASQANREQKAEEAARLQQERVALGKGLQDYLTPQQQDISLTLPGFTGEGTRDSGPMTVNATRSMQDILKTLPPELAATFVNQVAPIEQSREGKRAAARQQQALRSFVNTMPAALRPVMSTVIALEQAGVPGNITDSIVRASLAENAKNPQMMAALRKQFPSLANLPDEELVKAAAAVGIDRLRVRAGGAGGTPKPTGRTPAEIRAELSAINPLVTNARLMRNELTERPRNLTVGGLGNRPIVPRTAADSAAVGKFQADSTAAEQGLAGLMGTQSQLLAELQRAQGAPTQNPIEVEAAAVIANIQASTLPPAEKARRIAEVEKRKAQLLGAP